MCISHFLLHFDCSSPVYQLPFILSMHLITFNPTFIDKNRHLFLLLQFILCVFCFSKKPPVFLRAALVYAWSIKQLRRFPGSLVALRAVRAGMSTQAAGRRMVEVAPLFGGFFRPAAVVTVDVVDKSGKMLPVSVVFDPAVDNPAMRIVPTIRAGDCAIDGLGTIASACESRCCACKNAAGANGCQQDRQNTFLHFQSSFLIRVSSMNTPPPKRHE